jgi:hypothetical protein
MRGLTPPEGYNPAPRPAQRVEEHGESLLREKPDFAVRRMEMMHGLWPAGRRMRAWDAQMRRIQDSIVHRTPH